MNTLRPTHYACRDLSGVNSFVNLEYATRAGRRLSILVMLQQERSLFVRGTNRHVRLRVPIAPSLHQGTRDPGRLASHIFRFCFRFCFRFLSFFLRPPPSSTICVSSSRKSSNKCSRCTDNLYLRSSSHTKHCKHLIPTINAVALITSVFNSAALVNNVHTSSQYLVSRTQTLLLP
jgi:hypothetical protein